MNADFDLSLNFHISSGTQVETFYLISSQKDQVQLKFSQCFKIQYLIRRICVSVKLLIHLNEPSNVKLLHL